MDRLREFIKEQRKFLDNLFEEWLLNESLKVLADKSEFPEMPEAHILAIWSCMTGFVRID